MDSMDQMTGSGTIRPIVQVGDPVLAARCDEVTAFDDDLRALVADMVATMHAAEGVGLAANQIGVAQRVFVYDCPDDAGRRHAGVVCNPVLAPMPVADRTLDVEQEGCLSVQGQFADLGRPDRAVVTGVDEHGRPVRIEGTGLLARCLQHESDHLDGMLYIDRLAAKPRKRVLSAWRDAPPPPHWPVPTADGRL